MKQLGVFGAGGMAREVFFFAKDLHLKVGAFFDLRAHEPVYDVPVLDDDDFDPAEFLAVVAIGNPHLRRKIATRLADKQATFLTLIHPSVVIYGRDTVEVGDGGLICPGCMLTCEISLGRFAQLNLGTTLCHGVRAGDYFTTGPGVNVSGDVTIGHNVHLGTNSCVIERRTIGDDIMVGAGSCVVEDLLVPGIYAGSPAVWKAPWTP